MEEKKVRIRKAVFFGIIATILTFVSGFGVLYLFWNSASYDPNLPGLFGYYASSYGDAICLPFLVGSLVFYMFSYDVIEVKGND